MEETENVLGRGLDSLLQAAEGERHNVYKSAYQSSRIIVEPSARSANNNKTRTRSVRLVDPKTKHELAGISATFSSEFITCELRMPKPFLAGAAAAVVTTCALKHLIKAGRR